MHSAPYANMQLSHEYVFANRSMVVLVWLYVCGPIKYEISLVACTMYFVCQANGILKYSFYFLCVGLGLCTKNKEGST